MLRSSRTRTYVVQSVIGVALLYLLVVFSSSSWTGGITSSSVKQWADGGFSVLSTGSGSGGGSCGMCDVNPRLCEEYGGDNVVRSVSYMGSNHRLRRFLAKASRRQGFTVGLIGGSITAGHGLPRHDFTEKEPHRPNNLGRIIFDFLNERFPAPDGAAIGEEAIDTSKRQNVFVNGAQGGQGSEYFSKCFKQHIPEEADLVLVDASVNDQLFLTNMNSFEYMLRGLMDLPNNPAIIDIHLLALMFSQVALGGDLHFGILQEYDIPTISLRNTIYDETLRNKSALYEYFTHNPKGNMKDAEGLDLRHISWQGHQLAGNLTNTYLMTQMCEMERRGGYGDADKGPVHPLPRLLLMQKWDGTTQTGKFVPNCFTMMSSKDKLIPSENSGWREWAWENKKYIIADDPGSTIGFKFHTSSAGLDNDEDKAVRADGYWKEPYNIGRGIRIRSDLKPGDHVLRCRLLKETNDPTGKHEFRIISVMSITGCAARQDTEPNPTTAPKCTERHQTACSCLLILIASFQKTDWNSRDTSVSLNSPTEARSQIRSGGHPNAQVESSDNSGSISSGYNHTWSSNTVMPGFTNPFYSQGSTQIPPVSPSAAANPPSYDASTRPGRPTPPARPVVADQPVSYGSLSDLTKGRQGASSGFSYTPQPERQGYSSGFGGGSSSGGSGYRRDDAGSRDDGSGGRRMPPPPSNYGKEAPTAPPRRNVAPGERPTPPPPSKFQSYSNTAAGYIPNSVSATASTAGDKLRGGYDSVVNQQTKEQVLNGAGKAAAGAAKLAGKAAWQLGKFASGNR